MVTTFCKEQILSPRWNQFQKLLNLKLFYNVLILYMHQNLNFPKSKIISYGIEDTGFLHLDKFVVKNVSTYK